MCVDRCKLILLVAIDILIFINDRNRKLWKYLIKRKDEILEVFKKFKSMVKRKSDHIFKFLKMKGGGKYVSNAFVRFYDQKGIIHEVVPPYTP